jgi:hypothetical protein
MKTKNLDLINILDRMKDDGINEVDGEEFDTATRISLKIFNLINQYIEANGNISLSCGSEWLYQDDNAQVDALELAGCILDSLSEYAEDDKDEE